MHKWNVYPTFDQASKAAADFLAEKIIAFIEKNGVCHVILPGGKTPTQCLGYLATKMLPWNKIHWYPGDERCYPRGHAERNDTMLNEIFWSHISATNIHTIPTELGAKEAAAAFNEEIRSVEQFDIAFLGMGEDGHTASLFPGNAGLQDAGRVIPVYGSPKPPRDRVSLSMNTLRMTQHRMVLAGGKGKAGIVHSIKMGESLPINNIGDIDWYIDEAADSFAHA